MGRPTREARGGLVYHVLNRGVGRRTLFEKPDDYFALERILDETLRSRPMRICAYCLMPNHWHLVLWPQHDGDLSAFMQKMTNTHVKRWKRQFHETGYGHLYQGRFKSFPVQTKEYFYQVARYVERNAVRANLAPKAEDWPWSSLRRRSVADDSLPMLSKAILAEWPLVRPGDWSDIVNRPQTEAELETFRRCVNRGRPLGSSDWMIRTADELYPDLVAGTFFTAANSRCSTHGPHGRPVLHCTQVSQMPSAEPDDPYNRFIRNKLG